MLGGTAEPGAAGRAERLGGGDDQLAASTDLHAGDPLGDAGERGLIGQGERLRRTSRPRRIDLGAGVAAVGDEVDQDVAALLGLRPGADDEVGDLQLGDAVGGVTSIFGSSAAATGLTTATMSTMKDSASLALMISWPVGGVAP